MAYTKRQDTPISLDRWADIMNISPFAFHGIYLSCLEYNAPHCDKYWPQESWHGGANASREELATALISAEQDLETYLGHPIRTKWYCEDIILTDEEKRNFLCNGSLRLMLFRNNIIDFGRKSESFITNLQTYLSDNDNDGFSETVCVDIQSSLISDIEICSLGFRVFNSLNGSYYNLPKPVSCNYNDIDEIVTYCFNVWSMIKPEIVFSLFGNPDGIDICNPDNIVPEIELYSVLNNKDYPYVEISCEKSACSCGACDLCTKRIIYGCATIEDSCESIIEVRPANWVQQENGEYTLECYSDCSLCVPKSIRIYYSSSCDCNCSRLSQVGADSYCKYSMCNDGCYDYEVALLAAARLSNPVCECGCDHNTINSYREDWAVYENIPHPRRLMASDVANPFGTRAGEILVWRKLRNANKGLVTFGGVI